MATSPRYSVTRAFAYPTGKMIQTPDGDLEEKVYFTRDNQDQIEDVMSSEDIQDRVTRGFLVDSEAAVEEPPLAANEASGEEDVPKRRSRSRR